MVCLNTAEDQVMTEHTIEGKKIQFSEPQREGLKSGNECNTFLKCYPEHKLHSIILFPFNSTFWPS